MNAAKPAWAKYSRLHQIVFFFFTSNIFQHVVTKSGRSLRSGGQGFPPATFMEKRRKIWPKEIPSCLIPRLLVVFTRQLEISVTALQNDNKCQSWNQKRNFRKNKAICSLSFVFGTSIGYLRWKAKISMHIQTSFLTDQTNHCHSVGDNSQFWHFLCNSFSLI